MQFHVLVQPSDALTTTYAPDAGHEYFYPHAEDGEGGRIEGVRVDARQTVQYYLFYNGDDTLPAWMREERAPYINLVFNGEWPRATASAEPFVFEGDLGMNPEERAKLHIWVDVRACGPTVYRIDVTITVSRSTVLNDMQTFSMQELTDIAVRVRDSVLGARV
jgi:hypothetical protein